MTIVFFSLILNHHQAPVADSFYQLLGDNYKFVELRNCKEMKGGNSDYTTRPYLIQAWKSETKYQEAMVLATDADVCVFGGVEALPFMKMRMRQNLLSFDMGERWLKRGLINLLSPNLLKMYLSYWAYGWNKKNIYKLCSSAFAAKDHASLGMFKGKCYKWGYFTQVDCDFEIETTEHDAFASESTSLMWCARFLRWKHPELPVLLAARLKKKGYNFTLDMYGSGKEFLNTRKLISELGVGDCVNLYGNRPNDEILKEMRKHKVFLFTSDRNEGWGAVANEAMSTGCVLVGSDEIGSIPYLVKDGENGMIFESRNVDSLYQKVVYLFNNPSDIKRMSFKGIRYMQEVWSPNNAAKSLVRLIEYLQNKNILFLNEGPCSKAN